MLIKAVKHGVLFVWTVSMPGNSSSNTKMFLPFFNILEGLFPRWPGSAAPWLQLDPLKPSHPHPKWLSFFQSPSHDHPLSPPSVKSCFDLSRDGSWLAVAPCTDPGLGYPRRVNWGFSPFFVQYTNDPGRTFLHSWCRDLQICWTV